MDEAERKELLKAIEDAEHALEIAKKLISPPEIVVIHDAPGSACGEAGRITE